MAFFHPECWKMCCELSKFFNMQRSRFEDVILRDAGFDGRNSSLSHYLFPLLYHSSLFHYYQPLVRSHKQFCQPSSGKRGGSSAERVGNSKTIFVLKIGI